jgi:CheY-like chemotaxis protein
MMVDDDRGALKLADRMLRQRGYEAVCHSTAKAALRAARQRVPAAVILDLNMPELDGFQFLEQFRRQSDTRRIPVIVWSAMELTARQRKHLHASAQAVVSKSRGTWHAHRRAHRPRVPAGRPRGIARASRAPGCRPPPADPRASVGTGARIEHVA